MSGLTEQQALVFTRIADDVSDRIDAERPSSALGVGQTILDAVRKIISVAGHGVTVDDAVAAAKVAYDQYTAGDDPRIPNIVEIPLERLGWMLLEGFIRRLFRAAEPA